MARSADPLTAATTAILLPYLRPLGFRRKSGRIMARIEADILQYFDLQLSSYGSKDFCVNYASISLFNPRDHFVLEPGDRLNEPNGSAAWLPAATQIAADTSMNRVVEMIARQAVPFFEETKTVEGLLQHLDHVDWASEHHRRLEQACCAAKLGRVDVARSLASETVRLYRADGRSWCRERIELCERLLSAIANDGVAALMQQWTAQSITRLGLERLADGSSC